MSIDVRRSGDRFVTETAAHTTAHSFSFGAHYDAANLGFAAMSAHNDEQLPPDGGYPEHQHSDLEIVTWVLEGALVHTDSAGHRLVLAPGDLLRTSAGSGIVHSEVAEPGGATRFLQTWLRPDASGGMPSLARESWQPTAGFTEVVGPQAGLTVATSGASLHLAHSTGGSLVLPEAPLLHVFVAGGSAELGGSVLEPGDAARLVGEGACELTVPSSAVISVWAFQH